MAANALEQALEQATRDPGARPAFYRLLLESQVVVMLGPARDGRSRDGMELIVWTRNDGVRVIPFFSSLEVCKAVVSTQGPTPLGPTAIVPARALFKNARSLSMHMHLNPNHTWGREFVPEELASLLTHGTIHHGVSHTVLEADTRVGLRAPQEILPDFQTALASLLTTFPRVQTAYLFEMERIDPPAEAALIVGIVGPHDKALPHALGTIVTETYLGRLPVDLCFFTPQDCQLAALQDAMIVPFFERSWQGPPQPSPTRVQ